MGDLSGTATLFGCPGAAINQLLDTTFVGIPLARR
jgi:hypothetical protein